MAILMIDERRGSGDFQSGPSGVDGKILYFLLGDETAIVAEAYHATSAVSPLPSNSIPVLRRDTEVERKCGGNFVAPEGVTV